MTRQSHTDSFAVQFLTSCAREKSLHPRRTQPEDIEIFRRAGSLPVTALFAPTSSALLAALNKYRYLYNSEAWLVSDLSLGAWQAHQVARDCLAQIGYDKSELTSALGSAIAVGSDLDSHDKDIHTLGQIIDGECKGELGIIKALTLAQRVIAELSESEPRLFLVFMPRFGHAWRIENLAFLDFLTQALSNSEHRLILVAGAEDFSQPPKHWQLDWLLPPPPEGAASNPSQDTGLLRLIPGVIAPDVARVLAPIDPTTSCIKLSGGYLLVDPGCRRKPSPGLRLEYDKLGALRTLPDDCRALAQLHGNSYYCDPGLLRSEAWRLAGEGASDIAMDLMKRAVTCVRGKEQHAEFLLDLQGMRIASQQFEEAADIADPNEALPAETRGAIFQSKGWPLAVLGRAEEARNYLAAARTLQAPSLHGSRRFLYLNNIYALSLLKSGHPEDALRLEKEIESELDEHAANDGHRDWQLTYVNAINQARLFSILGDFEQSLGYYQRAFDTALGARSESDAVYVNLCLARLFGKYGRAYEAFNCWMRAGLHWVSAQIPEGLARRVSTSILHRHVQSGERVEEEISSALRRAILEAARAANVPLAAPLPGSSPIFRKRQHVPDAWRDGAMAVASDGWSVLATPLGCRAVYDGPQNKLLRALLFSTIRASSPSVAWDEIRSLLIEDALGLELPVTLPQVANMAIRLSLEKILYNDLRLELTHSHRKRLETALSVGIGAAVSRVRKINREQVVTFKRYLKPQTLFGIESQLLSAVEAQPIIMADLVTTFPEVGVESVIACVRRLEAARIINLELSEQALSSEISDPERSSAHTTLAAAIGRSVSTKSTINFGA